MGALAAIERAAQSTLAAELDDVLARRAETESQLTGGGRDALLALRGATQTLGVRHESAQRLLSELQSSWPTRAGHRPARRPPSWAAWPTTPMPPPARLSGNRTISRPGSASRGNASWRSSSRSRSAKGFRRPRVRSPRKVSSSRFSCSRSRRARSARRPPRSDIALRLCSQPIPRAGSS